jgi:C1A family cysteine protease
MPNSDYQKLNVGELRSVLTRENAGWTAAETLISQLTLREKKRRLGVQPPPGVTLDEIDARSRQRKAAIAAERAIGAPGLFDLRNVNGRNFITSIKDQATCGSCVAFGSVAAIEGTLRREQDDANLAVDLSEAHLFYCHGRARGRNCDNGWIPNEALACCQDPGIADEACYPYTPGDQNCSNLCSDWESRATKITSFQVISAVSAMKEWIATKGPMTACFVVFDDFTNYSSGIYRHVTGAQLGGHCVAIVGYNDQQGCWICKNSWSDHWGESGFFRIAYGECGIDTWQVCGVEGVKAPQDDEEAGVWENNRLLTGVWANSDERNAWTCVDGGVGWKRVAFDNDTIFTNMLTQLCAAKAGRRTVNLFVERDVIKQVYVL